MIIVDGCKEEVKGLHVKENENNKFKVVFLHYSADPNKTSQWADDVRATYDSEDKWRQEMELDFTKTEGARVYDKFSMDSNVVKLKHNPYRDIWRGWDFGYRHPACVWVQLDGNGGLNVLAELFGNNIIIQNFASMVKKVSKELFPGCSFKDAGDPAVSHANDQSERSTADILRHDFKIRIKYKVLEIMTGINLIRALVNPMQVGKDTMVRLKVDSERCPILVSGFMGGYVKGIDDKPIKDFYYDHLFDGLRYVTTVLFDHVRIQPVKPAYVFTRNRETASAYTGY